MQYFFFVGGGGLAVYLHIQTRCFLFCGQDFNLLLNLCTPNTDDPIILAAIASLPLGDGRPGGRPAGKRLIVTRYPVDLS